MYQIPENLKPLSKPQLPTIVELKTSGNPKQLMEDWEKEFNRIQDLNDQRFEKSLKRIKLCAFIRGLTNPFVGRINHNHHYSWCPAKYWIS